MDTFEPKPTEKSEMLTRKDALAAEERGRVEALITKQADLDVQNVR